MKNIPLPLILGAVAVGGYILLTRDNKDKANDTTATPTPTPSTTPPLDPDADYTELISEVNSVKSLAESNAAELSSVRSVSDANTLSLDNKADITSLASYTPVSDFNIYKTNTNTALGGKADQSSITSLENSLGSKADSSALANYTPVTEFNTYKSNTDTTLGSKADSSALANYTPVTEFNTYKSTTDNALGGKLDATAADDFASAAELETYQASTNTALGGKANQTALNDFQETTNSFFEDYDDELSSINTSLGGKANSSEVDAIAADVDGFDTGLTSALDAANLAQLTADANTENYQAQQLYQQDTIIPAIVDNTNKGNSNEEDISSNSDDISANTDSIATNTAGIATNVAAIGTKANSSALNNYATTSDLTALQDQIDSAFAPTTGNQSGAFFSGGRRKYRNDTFNFDGSADHKRGVGQIGFIPNAW